jgi:hypothetical protein
MHHWSALRMECYAPFTNRVNILASSTLVQTMKIKYAQVQSFAKSAIVGSRIFCSDPGNGSLPATSKGDPRKFSANWSYDSKVRCQKKRRLARASEGSYCVLPRISPSVLVRSCHSLLLQLGYDPAREEYPDWLASQPFAGMLPRVVAPGSVVGGVTKAIAERHGKTTFALV